MQPKQRRETVMPVLPSVLYSTALASQRIGPQLEFHDFALCTLTAFYVPDEVRPIVGVERAALPSDIGIVDAAVHPARVESKRIRNAEIRPLLGLRVERNQRIGIGSCSKGRVRAQSYYVVLIHPVVVMEIGGN